MIDQTVFLADSLSGAGKHNQAQTTPVIAAAPPAGQVATKDQPADVIIKKPSTSDAQETTQAIDRADPNSSGDKSTSNSSEVDKAPTDQTTPAKSAAEPKLGEDQALLPPPPTATPSPPPPPEKDATAINKPTPTSEEASVSPAQPAESEPSKGEDADKSSEPPAPPSKSEGPAAAAAAAKGDSSEPGASKEESAPQSGANGESHANDEGSAAAQDDDGKPEGATKPVLRLDRIRELSTATSMSGTSSAPGTPAEETASSAVEGEEDGGAPGSAGPLSKSKKKRERERERKKAKKKGEKNSPRPPSKETVNVVDNSPVQERKPVATAPVDIPKGEGEGELVEKVDSGEDSAVIVDKVESGEEAAVMVEKPQADAGKTADDTGSDGWPDWQ